MPELPSYAKGDPMGVTCPVCGAVPGNLCIRASANAGFTHLGRRQVAGGFKPGGATPERLTGREADR